MNSRTQKNVAIIVALNVVRGEKPHLINDVAPVILENECLSVRRFVIVIVKKLAAGADYSFGIIHPHAPDCDI